MNDYNIVTEKMQAAGIQFASDAVDAQVSKSMGGLGGSKTYQEWDQKDFKNKDLLLKYINGEIDSVTGIYLAMNREKIHDSILEQEYFRTRTRI